MPFRRSKLKLFIFLIVGQAFILVLVLSVFFYYKFYRPIYKDLYLFPSGHKSIPTSFGKITLDNIKKFNPNYITTEKGFLDDLYGGRDIKDKRFGLETEEVFNLSKKKRVYFVDVREKEEYETGHILNAVYIRGADLTLTLLKEKFNLSDNELNNSIFILVCHDGNRAYNLTRRFNKSNIKYLIGGIKYSGIENYFPLTGPKDAEEKLFGKKYQVKYQMTAEEALKMIKSRDVLIIDMRTKREYENTHIKGSIWLVIGQMNSKDYNNTLEKVLEYKGKEIIALPARYGQLFYANLLFYRLENYYGFDDRHFHIVFHQFDKLFKSPDIRIVSGSQ